MIRTTALSALLLTMMSTVACPQAADAPLVFEAGPPVPLAGAAPPDRAIAGDTYLLSFAVRNRTDRPVNLRRVVFRLQPGVSLIDPNIDRLDNDRDGMVDEGDEGFSRVDDTAVAWRVDAEAEAIAPGATAERAVKVRVLTTAEAGEALTVDLLAAASTGETAVRAERSIPFRLERPVLSISLNESTSEATYFASDEPLLRAAATIPSGQVSDLTIAVKGSPALDGYGDARVLVGKGVRCDATPIPEVDGRKISAAFGTCQMVGDEPISERFVAIEAEAQFRDADPFSDPAVISARRAVRIAAAITRGEQAIVPPQTVAARLTGPLIGARLISAPTQAVGAGDALKATYRLTNRGDVAPANLRLHVVDDGAIGCTSVAISDGERGRDACETGIGVGRLEPGAIRDFTVAARLREDALFDGATALKVTAKARNMAALHLPPAAYTLKMPPLLELAVDADGEWDASGEILTARIGDAGTVRITGELPAGRFAGGVRLLSRLVDAQTGEPIAPAPLLVETFTFSPAEGIEVEDTKADLTSDTEDGWTVVTLPLAEVSVPVTEKADDREFQAAATLSLRDLPEIQAGRVIEIMAQLSLYGTTDIRSDGWVELLIVEPSLDLTVRSPDEDRSIELHESARVAVLTCNRGTSSAEAVILTARLPKGLMVDDIEQAQVRTIRADRSADSAALFSDTVRPAGEAFHDLASNVLRGVMAEDRVLAPETCLALVFPVRRSGAYAPHVATAAIEAAVEPYTGRDGAQARIYSKVDAGAIKFALPPVRFGPVSEREVSGDRIVSHPVTLEIPAEAGPHRLDLATESSAGLDWTILRLNEDGAPEPWRNGTTIPSGQDVHFRFEARNPGTLPLGWIDTTLARALAFSASGEAVAATTRLITRRGEAPGGRIRVTKTMALDRDCDGDVGDERIQDALFEPVKDAAMGDCVIFRVVFRHTGDKSMERIVVRDKVPSGTELRPNAVEILRTPEPLQNSEMTSPRPGANDVVWSFEGLFEPGAEGEVSYAVKLVDER